MLPDKYRKVHRCLPLVMGVVFATTYSIPISGQPRIPTPSQSPTTEKPNPSRTQPALQTFGGQLAMFVGHEEKVTSAVFSPDGRQILTASADQTARLWDTKGNLLVMFQGDKAASRSGGFPGTRFSTAIFSPDGSQILTNTEYGVRLWDIKGNLLKEFRGDQERGEVTSAVFSPDGSKILTSSNFGNETVRLWNIKGNLLKEFQGHKARISAPVRPKAVFSPNGRQIFTVGSDGTARLWDIKGNLLKEFQGHKDRVANAVFSPDGRQILTASLDKTARLWDTNGNLLTEFQGHENHVQNAIFSPDGRQILTYSRQVRVWDTKGNLLAVFGQHGDSHWSSVSIATGFSPDGRQILTSSMDGTAQIWDTKGNLLAKLRGHKDLVWGVFSPDGRQIITLGWDKIARLWDVSAAIAAESEQIAVKESLQEGVSKNNAQLAIFRGHNSDVLSAVFSPDARQILTASQDKKARLWDIKGNLLIEFQGQEGVNSAVFSPDGRQTLTLSADADDNTTRLWDTQGNPLSVLRGSGSLGIYSAKFSPDGRHILTAGGNGGGDNTARLWDLKGNLLAELQPPEKLWGGIATSAVFSPDGRQILTASNDKTARLWNLKGHLLVEFRGHEEGVNSAVFSPDGRHILTTSLDNTARLWDTKGNLLVKFQEHERYLHSAVFSPDGSQILTASIEAANGIDPIARIWDTKGNLLAVFRGHERGITSAVFSPDGSQILTASSDGTARLWDVSVAIAAQAQQMAALQTFRESVSKNSAQLAELRDDKYGVQRAVFSPDSRQILTTTEQTVCLWNNSGNLLAQLPGRKHYVLSAVFSPDSRHILTASIDKTARLWDTKGNLLAIFQGHENDVNSAVFSPDGRQILTASQDKTARVWDIATGIKVSAAEVAFIKGTQLSSQGSVESRQLALQKLEEAFAGYRAEQNSAQATRTLLSMGKIYAHFGQFQSALDSYNQALPLSQQAGAKAEEAAIINSFGQLYTDLSDPKSALDYYNQALPLFYQLNDQATVANTLNNIGDIHAATGNWKNALDSYNKALVISRPAGNLAAEATALAGIGSTYIASKEWSTALNAYNQALKITRHLNDQVKETTVLNQLGKIQAALGQHSTAIENYNQALSLSQQLGYKTEEAHIIYNQAILNRQQNNLTVAQTEIETAINIIENLRTQIGSQELRQSYFARNQDYYQFYIDLLMQLHRTNPDKGYDAQAFHASERARARSLLELLSEASANIRQGVDSQLLAQEQNLQQQLSDFQSRKYQIVSAQSTPEAVDEIQEKIDTVLKELAQLEAKIRASSPRYAALKYPEPLNLQQIQQQVIDDNTLLLEYSLGEERSYLWAVTKTSFTSYELPSRTEIEATAKNFRDTLTKETTRTSPQMVAESAVLLSQMILAPVASEFGNKRLLIVADGALQYIPFSALTLEKSEAPLIVKHEIVNLPSASTLAILRRDMATRQPAPKAIALFADPVFSPDDERL